MASQNKINLIKIKNHLQNKNFKIDIEKLINAIVKIYNEVYLSLIHI